MSEADYSAEIADTLASIKESGKSMTLIRPNPVLDQVAQTIVDAPETHPFVALALPFEKGIGFAQKHIPEAIRVAKKLKLLIPAASLPFEPETNDLINVGGVHGDNWTVWASSPLAPAGAAILHTTVLYK